MLIHRNRVATSNGCHYCKTFCDDGSFFLFQVEQITGLAADRREVFKPMAVKCNLSPEKEDIVINTSDEEINRVCNNYIQDRDINIKQSVGFNVLLLYISHNIQFYPVVNNKPDYSDILKLDYYFMIFTELCSICGILPSVPNYCVFSGIPYYTVKDWRDGDRRSSTHAPFVKKWTEFCQSCCISEASGGNIGAIYISKALYGMSDSPAPNTYTQNNVYINTPPPPGTIGAKYRPELSDNMNDLNPENEL